MVGSNQRARLSTSEKTKKKTKKKTITILKQSGFRRQCRGQEFELKPYKTYQKDQLFEA